jgi:hypothetical protein
MRVPAYAITTILAACFAVAGCSPPPLHTDGRETGRIEIVPIKTYPTIQSRILLWAVGVRGVPAANAVDCYRVVYASSDEKGKPIALSGLLALPHGVAARGLVSFQHGTTSSRDFVPSKLSTDGLAAAIVFAGNGYAAIAPDYVGLGVSKRPHTYYVASDTARAVVDMIHAARHIAGVPAGPPFLIGFSEGGYASLVAQQALEASGEKVLADAAVSGAYNLRAISVPWTLKGASPNASTYLALWVRSYATRYGHSLESAFAPRYAVLVPKLFDTPHDVEAILKALPRDPRRLFTPAVLDAIAGRGDHWLVDALTENGISGWPAKAPIRLYYGTHDIDVLPLEAATTARLMAARGSDIRAVNVGTVDHDGTILAAAPLILEWLESFPGEPKAAVR